MDVGGLFGFGCQTVILGALVSLYSFSTNWAAEAIPRALPRGKKISTVTMIPTVFKVFRKFQKFFKSNLSELRVGIFFFSHFVAFSFHLR